MIAELGQHPSDLEAEDSSDEEDIDCGSMASVGGTLGVGVGGALIGASYNPPPPSSIVARLQKKRLKPSQPLPTPIVVQLVEMGFSRKKVELAVKTLGTMITIFRLQCWWTEKVYHLWVISEIQCFAFYENFQH